LLAGKGEEDGGNGVERAAVWGAAVVKVGKISGGLKGK
jgi:hypothetical protein